MQDFRRLENPKIANTNTNIRNIRDIIRDVGGDLKYLRDVRDAKIRNIPNMSEIQNRSGSSKMPKSRSELKKANIREMSNIGARG